MHEDYYDLAVARNLGLVTQEEQQRLRNSRIAIAGLGGVGGIHFLTLVRMGIGKFNIADLDEFDIVNTNRQIGATSSNVGRKKTAVMAEMARDIHPDVDLSIFNEGVREHNAEDFLQDVDAVVDSIDYFQMPARRLLYKTAEKMGKPVVFSAPIGFSATLHIFPAGGMTFDRFFDINDETSAYEKFVAFTVGLMPRGTHWKYMDTGTVDLSRHAGPSIASACDLSAGLLTTEIFSFLLNRRPPEGIPYYVQFDPYRRIYRRGRLLWGNRGPMQKLKRWFVSRKFRDQAHLL